MSTAINNEVGGYSAVHDKTDSFQDHQSHAVRRDAIHDLLDAKLRQKSAWPFDEAITVLHVQSCKKA